MSENNKTERFDNVKVPLEGVVIPHPYLFANGEFKFMYEGEIYIAYKYIPSGQFELTQNGNVVSYFTIDELKLIARPISDITDQEMDKYNDKRDYEMGACERNEFGAIINNAKRVYSNTPESMIYLLSIGVYPFDQQDFEEEWLIDASAV